MTARRFDPRLMLVTDAALCGERGVVETARKAVAGGATAVQVRAKDAPADELLRLVEAVARACPGTSVLVNDRVDVYLAARALDAPVAGVHVGQHDLPVPVVRALVGHEAVIGLTANRGDHLEDVARLPAGTVDYLGVGVIRPTPTKPDHPAALGVDGFAAVCAAAPVPCIAIGGIRPGDPAPIRRAGGAGVAVVSALCAATDPELEAALLREEWDRG